MDEMKRDRAEMLELQEKLKGLGQDPDLNKFFDTISATGNPKYVEMANQGRQKLKDQLSFANILGGGAAPQAAQQPQAAPSEPYPGYNEEIGMAAPANALAARQAPAPMQPQNAMAAQQPQNNMQQRINQAYQLGTPQALQWAKTQEANMKPSTDVSTMQSLGYPLTQAGFNAYRDAQRAEKLLTPQEEAQQLRMRAAGAPKTAINLGGGKYAEAVGGGMGKADVDKYDFAQTIPLALTKVNETLDILKKSDINTGLGAEVFTTLDRAKAKFTADKAAGVRVSNTEYLNSLLGSEVFPLIQSLGIGARGMDTPAEREFLREVMTGTISLNKDTLIRMAELRKKAMINAAEQYNKNVSSGELDKFFEASGRIKNKIEIPKEAPNKASAGAPPKAIEYLKANPGTRAQFEQMFPGVSVDQILGRGR
jgi:hypothetical protein